MIALRDTTGNARADTNFRYHGLHVDGVAVFPLRAGLITQRHPGEPRGHFGQRDVEIARRDFARDDPTAAQMINFPVGAGTSGHLMGGALAAVLVGPWVAFNLATLGSPLPREKTWLIP